MTSQASIRSDVYENSALVKADESDQSYFYVGDEKMKVCGTKVAIQIYIRPEKSSGGIIMTPGSRNRDILDSPVGQVVAMGDDAYKDDMVKSKYCKVGDWVLYPRSYASRLNWESKAHFAFVDDIHIMGVVPRPEGVKPAIPIDKF